MANNTTIRRHVFYARNIRLNINESFHELRPGIYALEDCDTNGKLNKKYVIVEVKK